MGRAVGPRPRGLWLDGILLLVLAVGAGFASFRGAQRIPQAMLTSERGNDVWFDSDLPRIVSNMSNRWADHRYVITQYPLFVLTAVPLVKGCQLAFHLDHLTALRAVTALIAALWMGTLFALLRLLSGRRVDAAVFSLLAATSASAVFWFTVPETWAFGSLTIVVALLVVALAQRRALSEGWYVFASALTLSMAVTNWMTGLCMTFARFPWRRALRISACALALVVMLWGVEQAAYPNVKMRSAQTQPGSLDASYVAVGSFTVAGAYVFGPMVMPMITTVSRLKHPGLRMTVRQSALIPAGPWSIPALWLWASLLTLGAWGAITTTRHRPLAVIVGVTLLGHFALRLLYGVYARQETFLYSLYWTPALVVLAAFSVLTRVRRLALALAGSLAFCVGINNAVQFDRAAQFAQWQAVSHLPAPSGEAISP